LLDNGTECILSKNTPNLQISINFSSQGNVSEFEEEEPETENEESSTDQELNEQINTSSKAKAYPAEAHIVFLDKENHPKGTFTLSCEIGADNRVYINSLVSYPGPKKEFKDNEDLPPTAIFENLNQEVQDRMYDLLDEIGIDDRMGAYLRQYCNRYDERETIEVLSNLQKIFSQ